MARRGEWALRRAPHRKGFARMAFVHLHNHTEYSMQDGITRLKDMANRAFELGMPACAITDHGYMFGCASWYLEAIAAGSPKGRPGPEWGVKPIIGCEVYFTPDDTLARNGRPELYHMILLAKDNTGYVNLMNIVSTAATKGFYYKPRTTLQSLRDHHEGIIATSACPSGIIPKCIIRGQREKAVEWAKTFAGIFGPDDFYIELQNHNNFLIGDKSGNTMYELDMARELDGLARELGLKTVATNDFHYLKQSDAGTQELMVALGRQQKVSDPAWKNPYPNDQFYMKTEEEMRQAFEMFQEACDNTVEIAEKCGARPDGVCDLTTGVEIKFGQILLPKYPGLRPGETHESQFRKDCEAGLAKHYGADWKTARPDVVERFEYEYKIICDKGFAAYFLIVADYVQWAKDNGIGVGPGRGSAAGAIVAYAMGITAFDPLANGLMFERFLSPERTEMPDIDMDFDDERRLDVIDYVRRRYGSDRVTHVITYSVLKAKAAINDANRVLGFPPGFGQKLSKMISNSPDKHNTLAAAMGEDEKGKEFFSPDFVKIYKEDADAAQVIDAARALEGLTRGEGVHACAVLIAPEPVNHHVPTKLDTKGQVEITQYEGHTVADMGLLKMDFLGLRTLTVLSKALKNIKATTGEDIVLEDIPFDDPKIFELMGSGHTAGVFQVESGGMTATIKNMKPTEYKHVVALIALYRPGPLGAGMVTSYINRMNGKEPAVSYDPRLDDILGETYGTMVYQEQVMQISVKMCGFSAGESDSRMRKPVAKKKIDMLTKDVFNWSDGATDETIYDHWMNGAAKNGYKKEIAQKIWDDVLQFASYAFNKSHSAGYAILVMQTAWLKAHYPNQYMAAVLTSYTGKTDKITHYIAACRYDGIEVLLPDVNQSGNEFTPVETGVRFGLAGIRGVGEGVSDLIVAEREANGPYRDIFDFVDRLDLSKLNRRVIESLVKAGAFDSTGYTRKQMAWLVSKDNPANIVDAAQRRQKNSAAGQLSMFDLLDEEDAGSANDRVPPDGVEWDNRDKLRLEKEVLGIYVSDHPLRPYGYALSKARDWELSQIDEESETTRGGMLIPEKKMFNWAGMVSGVQKKVTGKGDQMAVFTLEDMGGSVDVVVFPKVFAAKGALLFGEVDEATGEPVGDVFVQVRGNLERSDRGNQLIAQDISPLLLDEAHNRPKTLEIRITAALLNQSFIAGLSRIFSRYPGNDNVELLVEESSGRTMRAEVPMHVDAKNVALGVEVTDALGAQGTMAVIG